MRLTVLKNHVPINQLMVDTPDPGERYEIYVGRSEDCHVQIDDPLISRHHFVLKNDSGSWICEKLTQLGVVTINGVGDARIPIREGDEIKCGPYSVMIFDLPGVKPIPVVSTPVYAEAAPVTPSVPAGLDELSDLDHAEAPLEEMDATEVLSSHSNELDDPIIEESLSEDESFLSSEDTLKSEEITNEEMLPTESFGDSNEVASFGDSGDEEREEKTSFFKAFVNYQLVLFGEHAPYDRYQIDAPEIFIGRDPKKCQIILNDPEVSTVHAVLRKTNIDVTLEDLNSSNGTILNGERINKAHLTTGDEFVIGSTSFTLETRSDLLDAESDRLMPVETGQTIETEEIEEEVVSPEEGEANFASDAAPEKSLFKRFKKDQAFRKKVIYTLVGVTFFYVLFGPDEEPASVATPDAKTAEAKPDPNKDKNAKPKLQLSKELEQRRNMAYELGVSFFEQNKYFEALKEFQVVTEIDAEYKKVQTYLEQTKEGLKRLEELEAQKRAEEERIKNKKIIEELLVKARDAVKEKLVTVAESYFAQITEKDPENIEVQQLKMELEAWQKEQERVALEKAAKEAARKAMVDALLPGKTYYLKKEWYKAILKLEDFLRRKGSDEDLVKEGSDMLSDAKNQLASDLGPMIGKARSLKEGQDLKTAYEAYLEILKIEPSNAEALNEIDEIKSQLDTRSKKLYREAIIAESLSLFTDAKEKFQEVQQISPSDSEYYKKASEKLKNYLE